MMQNSNDCDHPFLTRWKGLPIKEFTLSYQVRKDNGIWTRKVSTIKAQAKELAITTLIEIAKLEGHSVVSGIQVVE